MFEMNKLIPIIEQDNGDIAISGRALHEFLEVKTAYKDWFPRMTEYGFVEGEDFSSFLSESTGGRPSTDHVLRLNMAKELSMIQRTERGKQARQYFIEIERRYNSPEMAMARGIKAAEKVLADKDRLIAEMTPKAIFADAVSASHNSILIGEMAKLLRQNGAEDMGQNRFFEWLRVNGYLIRRKGSDYNLPTQRSMELGIMEIKETAITHSDGHITINKTPKITGKGQQYFVNMFIKTPALV